MNASTLVTTFPSTSATILTFEDIDTANEIKRRDPSLLLPVRRYGDTLLDALSSHDTNDPAR